MRICGKYLLELFCSNKFFTIQMCIEIIVNVDIVNELSLPHYGSKRFTGSSRSINILFLKVHALPRATLLKA